MSSSFAATASFDATAVAASLLLALATSYQALAIVGRAHPRKGLRDVAVLCAGALSFGTGMWSMHFVSMLGYQIGTPLGYALQETLLSWGLAVIAAGIGLHVATLRRPGHGALALAAVCVAAAIVGMHYVGISGLVLSPGIDWAWPWVLASVAIAVLASSGAMSGFLRMRSLRGVRRRRFHLVASVLMAAAIAGVHFAAMQAMHIQAGALCLTLDGLGGASLGYLIFGVSMVSVVGGQMLLHLDRQHTRRETGLTQSLVQVSGQLTQAHHELERQSMIDTLTGLPNRMLFEDRLANTLLRCERTVDRSSGLQRLAVVTVDLDGFQLINQIFGHGTGDTILKVAAQRLADHARAGDTLARLGADEFGLILESDDAEALAVQLSERFRQSLAQTFEIEGRDLLLSCATGIALHPRHADDASRLLACAELATRAAKERGGSACVVYRQTMSNHADAVDLQSDLRKALQLGELALHYQPKIDARTLTVHGVEALLRWTHPTRGPVSPGVFIPIAERFGMMGPIGDWVIDEACAQLQAWKRQGLDLRVAINISAQQLRSGELASQVIRTLRKYELDASQLVCEVTESCMMENMAAAQAALTELGRCGILISIDDFGTGYSSLSHLRDLPARQIKIDRSFIVDLETNAQAKTLLDAIVGLAHAIDLEVVAEGVETDAQRQMLTRAGCDVLQGFLFARPMPSGTLQSWLRQRESRDRVATTPTPSKVAA